MKILIVGSGFVGMNAARHLAAQGHQLRLVEKAEEKRASEGSGICLPAHAVGRMADLGLKDLLMERAHRVRQVIFLRADGALLSEASLDEPPLNCQPFVALPRAELMALLAENLSLPIEYGTQVVSLSEQDDGVRVRDNHGTEEVYHLVVGADGIFSSIRKMLFPDWEVLDFGLTTWRFLLEQPRHGMQPTYIAGANDFFMFYPVSPDSLYCYGHGPARQGDERGKKDRMREQFAGYFAQVREAIEATGEERIVVGRTLSLKPPCRAYQGRVALIGDAMHGCPPSMQAGLDLGLEDVLVLGRCLGPEVTPELLPTALATFAQQREPHVSWVVAHSNKMVKLAKLGRSAWGRCLRDRVVRRNGPPNVLAWRKVLERGFHSSNAPAKV